MAKAIKKRNKKYNPNSKQAIKTKEMKELTHENDGWRKVNDWHNTILEGLAAPSYIVPLLEDPRIDKQFTGDERERLVEDIRILGRDTNKFKAMIDEIHDMHKDRSGPVTEIEDVMDVVNISQEYTKIFTDMEISFVPPLLSVSKRLEDARDKVIEEQNKILAEFTEKNSSSQTYDESLGEVNVGE